MPTLSILDQSPLRAGETAADAFGETLRLAEAADRLGYSRYWVAEHHGSAGLAGSAPEILIGQIAARTRRIRVGSGGVMLNHYSPLKVAETFRVLETLFPGRIDLGLGRAPGSDQLTAVALAPGYAPVPIEHFPRQLADLFGFLHGTVPVDHPLARVRVTPAPATTPETWLLGSSDQSALMAAWFGQAFSFAHFISGEGGPEAMAAYRRNFRPSEQRPEPVGSIAVHVVCAATAEEADRLAMCRDLWRLRIERGQNQPFPSLEEARAYPYSDAERERIARHRRRQVVGSPDQVRTRLDLLAAEYAVDEIVVVTITPDLASRLRSYELVAEVYDLATG